jgi:rod shape determining protein RodA
LNLPRIWRHFDYILLGVTIILIIIGVMMVASATRGAIDPDLQARVQRQIMYAVAGLAAALVLAAVDYHFLTDTYLWIYGLIVGLLGIVGILGTVGELGAQRWINLGAIPVQPSELAKMLLIIALARQLANNYDQIHRLPTVLKSLAFMALPVVFIFIQPDLGTTVLILVVWFAMVWAAGMRWQHLALFAIVTLVALPVLWSVMEPYQRARIATFVSPESDPGAAYNIEQALIAIGNGGVMGRGYMQGPQSQLRYLRVRHTDFIFAVLAEEFGFVGVAVVLVLMALIIWRILRGAQIAQDPEGSLICYGVATVIFFQTLVSIGMNVNVLPVTGLTLPFISSGGSSLMTLLFGVGLVESVIIRRPAFEY